MSLDFYLEDLPREVDCTCDCCDNVHKRIETPIIFKINITHNCGTMADEAGIYKAMWRPEEIGITKAKEMIPILEEGLLVLHAEPLHFKGFNPENGFGSYEGLLKVSLNILEACKEFPESNVRASR